MALVDHFIGHMMLMTSAVTHILCTVEIPITAIGRQYNLRHQGCEKIEEPTLAFCLLL